MKTPLIFPIFLGSLISCHTRQARIEAIFDDLNDFKMAVSVEMKSRRQGELSVDQCLFLIRMYNTINYYGVSDSICDYYEKIFDNIYKNIVYKTLELKSDGEWILYSKRYNIVMGGNLYTQEGLFYIVNAPKDLKKVYDSLPIKVQN